MFKEGIDKNLVLEEDKKPASQRLKEMDDTEEAFSMETLSELSKKNPHFSEVLQEAVGHATEYAEKVMRMSRLSKNVKVDAASRNEMEQLIKEQSGDKDRFLEKLRELHEAMEKEGVDSGLAPYLDNEGNKKSIRLTKLALKAAFWKEQRGGQ